MRGEGGKGKRAWKSKKKTKKRELMSAKIIQHQGQLSLQFTHSAIKRKQCSLYIRWSLMRLRLFNVCLLFLSILYGRKKTITHSFGSHHPTSCCHLRRVTLSYLYSTCVLFTLTLVSGVIPSQVQNPAFGLFKFKPINHCPML